MIDNTGVWRFTLKDGRTVTPSEIQDYRLQQLSGVPIISVLTAEGWHQVAKWYHVTRPSVKFCSGMQ